MNQIRRIRTVAAWAVCALVGAAASAGENLIFNGSFELGTGGFELIRYMHPDRNPGFVYEAPVVETSDHIGGSRCLRIPNSHRDHFALHARGVKLTPGKTYTIIATLRSDQDQTITLSVVGSDWSSRAGYCGARAKWQRFYRAFTLPDNAVKDYMVYIRTYGNDTVPAAQLTPASNIWIDDFQLLEGNLTPTGEVGVDVVVRDVTAATDGSLFKPSAAVDVAAVAAKDAYFEKDGSASVQVTVHNNGTSTVSGTISLRLEEEHGGADRTVGSVTVAALAADAQQTSMVAVPLDRYGSYTVRPVPNLNVTDVSVVPAWYGSAGTYTPKAGPLDLDHTYVVGINTGAGQDYSQPDIIPACNESPDGFFRTFASLGGRLFRTWVYRWGVVQPAADKWAFTLTDYFTDKSSEYGIAVVPIFGTVFFNHANEKVPALPTWVVSNHSDDSSYVYDSAKVYLPHDDVWAGYVDKLVERYADRITHWEVLNEPNLWIGSKDSDKILATAKTYCRYLTVAHDTIAGRGKTVGFCVTGDLGGKTAAFLEAAYTAGGLPYADAVSFHPYDSRQLGSPSPADEAITTIKELGAEAGYPNMPVWNTELYYMADNNENGGNEAIEPMHVARRFLTDLGEGLAQSCGLAPAAIWKKTINISGPNGSTVTRWVPSANLIAYNALARHFEGAKPVAKIHWRSDTICYVYERDGAPLAAVWWFHRPEVEQMVTLPAGLEKTEILDVFGNPGSTTGVVTPHSVPQYLIPPAGVTTTDFVAALNTAGPVEISTVPAVASALGERVTLRARVLAWPDRTIQSVAFSAGGLALGNATFNAVSGFWELGYTTTATGGVTLSATAGDSAGGTRSGAHQLVVGTLGTYGNNGQPWQVPTSGAVHIEAEYFDQGGEGAGYHDNGPFFGQWTGRSLETTSEVDIHDSTEGPAVCAYSAGEWLRYTVNVPSDGTYRIRVRYSSERADGSKCFRFYWNGVPLGDALPVTKTTDDTSKRVFASVETVVALPAGTGLMKLYCSSWGTFWNWIEIEPVATGPAITPVCTAPQVSRAIVAAGTPASIAIDAIGTAPLRYQWQHSTNGTTFSDISGAVATRYMLTSAKASDTGHYRVVVANDAGSATSNSVYLYVTSFTTWIASKLPNGTTAQRAATADPDGDGLCNLVEYGLYTNPGAANAAPVPELWTDPSNGNRYLALTFTHASWVSVVPEISSDLVNWSSDAEAIVHVGPATVGSGSAYETVTFRCTERTTDAARRFFRLKVVSP